MELSIIILPWSQESNSEESPAIRIATSATFDQHKVAGEYWLRAAAGAGNGDGLAEEAQEGLAPSVERWLASFEAVALSMLPYQVHRS
jgi:hypothetical protein